MAFAVVISVLATTQVAIIGTSRLLFSMSRDKVLPKRLGVIHERYRTPAFTTLILGALVIIFGVVDIYQSSVATAISDLVTVSGFLYSMFYAITALAASFYYRRIILKSPKDTLLLGVLPLAGAALLLWVAVKAAQALTGAEAGILIALGVVGILLMLVASIWRKAPIFSVKMEAAKSDAATVHVGVD
jgi:amino acid transporter